MTLEGLVVRSAARVPERTAVRGPDQTLTYRALDEEANRLARALQQSGVTRGGRVGVWIEKGARAVVAMQAALRLGAAYVPLDPLSPTPRALGIALDCEMAAVVTTAARARDLRAAGLPERTRLISLEASGGDLAWPEVEALSPSALPPPGAGEQDLAYILYTSGSTGTPKGVCISHLNALAFIRWAFEELQANEEDRFSNHAPFFFDLSVLDLYVAFLAGASVAIVPEAAAYAPRRLVEFLVQEQITVWYSVPSALILMMEQGGLLEVEVPSLRALLFAGEPFPLKHLRRLRERFPAPRYLNLYGPTETNVCTWHEVGTLDPERTDPVPIGKASCGDRVWLMPAPPVDGEAPEHGPDVGELMVEGPTVMLGYWGREPQGGRPYATGDLCRLLPDGNYEYLGRRDNMVKVRGRRIEPAEIEAVLAAHADTREVAVVAAGKGLEARLVAFIVATGDGPSLVEVKRRCAEKLPRYMVVDSARPVAALPRTRNGKVDRRTLREWAEAAPARPVERSPA